MFRSWGFFSRRHVRTVATTSPMPGGYVNSSPARVATAKVVFSTRIKTNSQEDALEQVRRLFPQNTVVCPGEVRNGWWLVEVWDNGRD